MTFDPDIMMVVFLLIGLGCVSGFLAGLLGIGSGAILVIGLHAVFTHMGFVGAHLMHVCLGTSMAIIVCTGFSSARAHYRKGGVQMALVRRIGAGIVLGTIIAAVIVGQVSSHFLQVFFACMLVMLALMMWFNPAKKLAALEGEYHMPSLPSSSIAGVVIGALSSLIGIGGATMSVPYMSFYHVPLHKAVGTASALGLVISVPAALGYMIVGWGAEDLPPFSLGYVNLLAWALIVPFGFMMAPVGAHAAYKMPVSLLRKFFALFLFVLAIKMGWSTLHG